MPSLDPSAYRDVPFTYPQVGATAGPDLPPGYRHLSRTVVLGHGDEVRSRALEHLLTWGMHRAAGLGVHPQSERVRAGEVVVRRIGPLTAPCTRGAGGPGRRAAGRLRLRHPPRPPRDR